MGLDIYFRKQRHQGMYDAIAEINEQMTEFVNAEYNLSVEQIDILNKEYELAHETNDYSKVNEMIRDFCTPTWLEVADNVKAIMDKYNNDELKSEIVVTIPVKDADAVDCFDMGKFEKTEAAYFRKVNFLLPFFGYEENCSDIEIDKYQVEDLVNACQTILDTLKTSGTQAATEVANEMLPTEGGFFFGSTEYDEWYFKDVEYVLNKFTTILDDTDWDNETIYMHCWW